MSVCELCLCDTMSEEKKENETKSLWSVTITHFTDDYKPRGGDWSSSDEPKMFTTERQANRWLRRYLMDWCFSEIRDRDQGDDDDNKRYEELKKRYNAIYDSKRYDDIKALAEELAIGEFVARRLSWKVDEVEIEEDMPEVGRIGKKDDAGSDTDDDSDEKKETKKNKWCTSCLHALDQHIFSEDCSTKCSGCEGALCPYYNTTTKQPTEEQVTERNTTEAKARRKRQYDGEDPYTDEESEDDLDEKPHRKHKKAKVESA